MRVLPSLMMLSTVITPVHSRAADVTDLPPRFRADLSLGYLGSFEQVGLEEAGTSYAIRQTDRHELDLQATVAVWSGLGVTLGLPTTPAQTIAWPGARAMRVDPLTGQGSYANGGEIDVPSIESAGVAGVWLGIAASPFREGWTRSLPVTLRFDLAVRTPAPRSTLYGARRGVAPGGAALRLNLAMSKIFGRTDTWISMRYVRELAASDVEVSLPDGTSATPITVRAGDQLSARIGGVRLLHRDPDKGTRTGIGVWAGVDWLGEARRASGFWLPDVLPTVRGSEVVASDRLAARLGLSFEVDPLRQLGMRLGVDGSYLTPRTEEHPFPVATDAGSWAIGWQLTLIGRVRLKDEPRVAGAPSP